LSVEFIDPLFDLPFEPFEHALRVIFWDVFHLDPSDEMSFYQLSWEVWKLFLEALDGGFEGDGLLARPDQLTQIGIKLDIFK
jgi:hypothetical protein